MHVKQPLKWSAHALIDGSWLFHRNCMDWLCFTSNFKPHSRLIVLLLFWTIEGFLWNCSRRLQSSLVSKVSGGSPLIDKSRNYPLGILFIVMSWNIRILSWYSFISKIFSHWVATLNSCGCPCTSKCSSSSHLKKSVLNLGIRAFWKSRFSDGLKYRACYLHGTYLLKI